MKKLTIAVLFLSFFASSCKKCYDCHNQCWQCTNATPSTLCSTDYASKEQFEAILHDFENYGSVCTQINSTKQKDICDASAETLLDQSGFYCSSK